jgi:hypothetical protein
LNFINGFKSAGEIVDLASMDEDRTIEIEENEETNLKKRKIGKE